MKKVKQGFTLIELLIVVAIIAMIAAIGIKNYGNIRTIQAKKLNAANIKRIFNALAEYNEIRTGVNGRFDCFDSLIDMKCNSLSSDEVTAEDGGAAQTDAGKAGTFVWKKPTDTESILYNGCWKLLGDYDSDAAKATREGQSANEGIPDGLANMVGIYYLTESEAKLVREAGISSVLMHNKTTGTPICKDQRGGGGPGFRADMSAFGPVTVSNGTPVVVFRPDAASVWAAMKPIGNFLYEDLGCSLGTNRTDLLTGCRSGTSPAYPVPSAFENLLASKKLIAFGIGRGAECVISKVGLGEAPVNPMYERKYYRQYLAVFALTTGNARTGGSSSCELVGVVDCAGLTQNGANYVANWQSDGE